MKKYLIVAFTALFATSIQGFAQMSLKGESASVNEHVLKTVKLSTGVSLNYVEQGQKGAVPVIFIHGYSDSWRSFEKVLSLLPTSVHAFAVTLRGHGDSDKPMSEYTPVEFAKDIAAFVQDLQIGAVIVTGHSLGGTVAQQFAKDFPELCRGLVLAATFSSFDNKPMVQELSMMINQFTDPVDPSFLYEFQKSTLSREIAASELNLYVSESKKLPAYAWKAIINGLINAKPMEGSEKISVPTLLIWGDKDAVTPEADQQELLRNIRNARLIVYKNTGHAVHWEEPARFANDLESFINKIR